MKLKSARTSCIALLASTLVACGDEEITLGADAPGDAVSETSDTGGNVDADAEVGAGDAEVGQDADETEADAADVAEIQMDVEDADDLSNDAGDLPDDAADGTDDEASPDADNSDAPDDLVDLPPDPDATDAADTAADADPDSTSEDTPDDDAPADVEADADVEDIADSDFDSEDTEVAFDADALADGDDADFDVDADFDADAEDIDVELDTVDEDTDFDFDADDADTELADADDISDVDDDAADASDADTSELCGTQTITGSTIRGTEGIAIAPDGTVYYSQSGAVGRRTPDGTVTNNWVTLAGASTVWGLALRDDGMLYVGSPSSSGRIFRIDTLSADPAAEILLSAAGSANGVTVGPDGYIYYSDFAGGHVYSVDDAGGRVRVSQSTFTSPNGILFTDPFTMYVLSYTEGRLYRVELSETGQEVSRAVAVTISGASPDGILQDDAGFFYISDNGGGRVYRFNADFTGRTQILMGVSAAANMAFGRGVLNCDDLYVTSSGNLQRYRR